MKRLLLSFMGFLLLSSGFAQDIKIYGGADWTRYNGPGFAGSLPSAYTPGSTWGGLVGAGINFPLFSGFSADVGLQYFRKGSRDSLVNPSPMESYYEAYGLDVLSLPVCLRFKPLGEDYIYILGGGEFSYVLRHSMTITSSSSGLVYTGSIRDFTKKFDAALVAGVGGEVAMSRRWATFVEARYYFGLVDLSNPPPYFINGGYSGSGFKTRALALQAGVKYRIGS
jgi:hypothetical protein